jgi:hypothetical protein
VPSNVAAGTNQRCGKYYTAVGGDTCEKWGRVFGIGFGDLRFLNPIINSGCANIQPGVAYCIAPVGSIESYSGYNPGQVGPSAACTDRFPPAACYAANATMAPTASFIASDHTFATPTTSTSQLPAKTATPLPRAPGTISTCFAYVQWASAPDTDFEQTLNSCKSIAAFYHITVDVFRSRNPDLPSSNCIIKKDYSYCVWASKRKRESTKWG